VIGISTPTLRARSRTERVFLTPTGVPRSSGRVVSASPLIADDGQTKTSIFGARAGLLE